MGARKKHSKTISADNPSVETFAFANGGVDLLSADVSSNYAPSVSCFA